MDSNTLRFFRDMDQRKEDGRHDSDVTLFLELLYLGEFCVKLTALGLAAAIRDDLDRSRYRQLHRLVRADGLGDWASVIQDTLNGPPSQSLDPEAQVEQSELNHQAGPGTWQHTSVTELAEVLTDLGLPVDTVRDRTKGLVWFDLFARLRNGTRAHGAYMPGQLSRVCARLERSLTLLMENFSLFARPWAYLHRNLSGKYRVIPLGGPQDTFETFKKSRDLRAPDGVYIGFSRPSRVELAEADADAVDLLLPNGAFNDASYEVMSYLTGSRRRGDSTPYLAPATSLPLSETNGLSDLDVRGKCHSNMPLPPGDYVRRPAVEDDLQGVLNNDRHPMVTLSGRGGIGKTWLTLRVLSEIAANGRFDVILWFSARDIDLLPQGPALVRPAVLSRRDVAREVVRLVQPAEAQVRGFDAEQYLARILGSQDLGPVLYVFDNFETIRDPADVFSWLDNYVRPPNKVLVTTRVREFKGDYPVDVPGMTDQEAQELISQTSAALGISSLITSRYRDELIQESGGHPYVMKVLLGEVARTRIAGSIQRLTASQDRILDALFERTWASLSPAAKRCFLTLSSWRSAIPRIALEAVLVRPENDRIDVEAALEELRRFSFIESTVSSNDGEEFLWLPLVAFEFGRKKLATAPDRDAIRIDVQFLQRFGANQKSDLPKGFGAALQRFVDATAEKVADDLGDLGEHRAILEYIAGKYPPTWLFLSTLYEEVGGQGALGNAVNAAKRYIEEVQADGDPADAYKGWMRLAELSRRAADRLQELLSLVEAGVCSDSIDAISDVANRVNSLLSDYLPDSDDKRHLVSRLSVEMERRLSTASATDCSRLAWLYLHMGRDQDARRVTGVGLSLDANNRYCRALATRLGMLPIGGAG